MSTDSPLGYLPVFSHRVPHELSSSLRDGKKTLDSREITEGWSAHKRLCAGGGWMGQLQGDNDPRSRRRQEGPVCVCACVCAAHDCDSITKNNIGRGVIETSAVCVQWKESGKKEGKMEGKEEEGEET